jgi:type IV pilus assembly protein PilX
MGTHMTTITQTPRMHSRQRGAILVTSMLLLIVLTVLGVAMMRMTTMQERMAGNTRDLNLALQAAEAALRDGEDRLTPARLSAKPRAQASAGCTYCEATFLPVAIQDSTQFDWSTALEYGTAGTQDIAGLAEDPRYVIAEVGYVPDTQLTGQNDTLSGRDFYQITARSTGASGQANTVLQSTYPRRF